jgi:hypothetical protein
MTFRPPFRCDHCPQMFAWRSAYCTAETEARVRGWRFFDGTTLGDQHIKHILCPACFDRPVIGDLECA